MTMYKLTNTDSIVRTADGAYIPADERNSDYAKYLAWVSAGNVAEPADPISPVIPQSVTPLQATRALLQAGFLDAVEAAVAAADRETQLAWAKATAFERNSPFVLGMKTVLGWTDEQVDSLFILAATL
jgi:hypothetical protein